MLTMTYPRIVISGIHNILTPKKKEKSKIGKN